MRCNPGGIGAGSFPVIQRSRRKLAACRCMICCPDTAKEVADLVATTDGIIFRLWSHEDTVPSGHVIIAQSVGHVNFTAAEFKKGGAASPGKTQRSGRHRRETFDVLQTGFVTHSDRSRRAAGAQVVSRRR